jgi:hypothetical protein
MNARRSLLMLCVACCAVGSLAAVGAVSAFAASPVVEEEFATRATSNTATLNATVNPEGEAASYRFEYSSGGGTFQPVPGGEGQLGEGSIGVHVKAELEGLTPDTTYSFRVTPTYSGGSVPPGTATVFTTKSFGAPSTLVDGRQWEMVSPQNKHGAGIEAMNYGGGVLQAAENGSALTYWANGPIVSTPVGNTALENSQILSKRETSGVWSSRDIVTGNEGTTIIPEGIGSEYKTFSSDLSRAVLEPHGETLLPAPSKSGTEEQTIYMRDNVGNAYQALVSEENVIPNAHFGEIFGSQKISFKGASLDLKHVLFDSRETLTAEPGVEPAAIRGFENIYEWSGETGQVGTVNLVSLLPQGQESTASRSQPGDLGSSTRVGRDVISTDGSRVVWTGGPDNSGGLYVTDLKKHESLLVASPGPAGEPRFQDANDEGTRIFFLDGEPLVNGADEQSGSGRGDLYVEEVPRTGTALAGTLHDLTADTHQLNGQKENASVRGTVIGYGTEGVGAAESSNVYFVDGGVLAANKGWAEQEAVSGGNNLYVAQFSGGEWRAPRFIAQLAPEDAKTFGASWSGGESYTTLSLSDLTAGVSGSGRFFTFMSSEPLTGFDNRDAASGVRDEEVFLYDAAKEKLVCASCNKFGVRPHGILDPVVTSGKPLLVDGPHAWEEHWLAGNVPGRYANVDYADAEYEPRFLSDSGRLLFDSPDTLVPGDSNGREDVYEYEPEGVGSCSPDVHSQDVVFGEGAGVNGCVALVSSGTSSEESAFLDASGKGPGGEEAEDVFFLTESQLASDDIDSAFDVYDAHECSSTVPCALGAGNVPPACIDADSCRMAPPPQPNIFGAPSSATFAGPGNQLREGSVVPTRTKKLTRARLLAQALAACKHRPKRHRAGCIMRARREFGSNHGTTSIVGRRK